MTELSHNLVSEPKALSLPKLNPRRYFWIVVGYYVFSTYIKASAGSPNLNRTHSGIRNILDSSATFEESTEHSAHHEGIQIFKFDWNNVESITIIALWIFFASLAKVVFHMTPKLGHIFPESCLLIVVGILIGLLIYYTGLEMDNNLPTKTFFFFMLPPIILDAGYFMPGRLFFGNLGTIVLFAVVGTLWNTFTIGLSLWGLARTNFFGIEIGILEMLLFSTLISAVDPVAVLAVFEEIHVNDILYIVVFGESLLNDAVTVVLYHMFEEYVVMGSEKVTPVEIAKGIASFPVVALGGTLIGILWGFLTGYLTKFTNRVQVIEPIFVFVLAYMSHLNAELFHMSGVLAITFCGITMKKYVEANITENSRITVKYAMKMLSSSSETIIFMFLGMSTASNKHVLNWWFILATIVFCTVYRFLGVLWMSALANRFRLNKLSMMDQLVMSYGGLRGAVSFALVLLIGENAIESGEIRNMFVTTTIAVVFFTVFFQGITIKPFVAWVNVKLKKERELTMNERMHEKVMDHLLSGIEIILGTTGQNRVRDKVKEIDEKYIRPNLIRDYEARALSLAKLLVTHSKLVREDAIKEAHKRKEQTVPEVHEPVDDSPEPVDDSPEPVDDSPEPETPTTLHSPGLSDLEAGRKTSQASGNIRSRKVSHGSRKISQVSRKKSSQVEVDADDLFFSEDVFLPSKKLRKISYSRHTLEPADLQPELSIANPYIPYVPVQGIPRRKYGMAPPHLHPGGGVGVSNTAFVFEDEHMHMIGGSSTSPSRRISHQESPNSPSSLLSLSGQPNRRYSTATVGRPAPTAQDLESPNPARAEYPRSPPPIPTTIEEEPSSD